MSESPSLILYHAPRTRAFTTLWLLEELGAPYRIEHMDLKSGAHKRPEHLARNPMGKVPAIVDGDVSISETGAIAIYLADKYAPGRLAPALDDPRRAAYLRWSIFPFAVGEPAMAEKLFKWQVPASSVGWGSFDDALRVMTAAVQPGPWLLGEQFTSADVVMAALARYGQMFGAFPKEGPLLEYVSRATARPAFQRAMAIEERQLAAHSPPA